jgi:hypothetical protein
MDVMESHISAAESELMDEVDISLHGNGTRFGGKELGGLQLAIPTVVNSGTYGGIDRAPMPSGARASSTPTRSSTAIGTQVTPRPSVRCSTAS